MRTAFKPLCSVMAAATVLVAAGAVAISGPHEKVDLCHKGRVTINVDWHAVPAHLAHGDQPGRCGGPV